MHVLYNFPLPASANKQLTLGNGRFIKTQAARLFTEQVKIYGIKKFREIQKIKEQLPKECLLQVDCYFVFLESRIIGKKGQIKMLDANNFVKACLDGVATILEIDDKYFVANHVEKVTCQRQSDEQAIIKIRPANLQSLETITRQITHGTPQ